MDKHRQGVFDSIFSKQVKHYIHSRDGKNVDAELVCHHAGIKALVDRTRRKHSERGEHSDFMAQAAVSTYEAILRFEPVDGSWGAFSEVDTKRLYKYILTSVGKEMNLLTDPDSQRLFKDAKEFRMELNLVHIEALAGPTNDLDAYEALSEKLSLMSGGDHAFQANVFMEWFLENKGDILTSKQLMVYEKMKGLQYDRSAYTLNDIEQEMQMQMDDIRQYYRRIEDRVLKAWMKNEKKTFAQRIRERELKQLNPLLALMDHEELADMNRLMSEWFYDNMETESVNHIIADHLRLEDSIAFNRCMAERVCLPAKILYLLVGKIEERVQELAKPPVPPTRCTVRPGENSFDRTRNRDARRIYEEFTKVQPCYTNDGLTFIPAKPAKAPRPRYTLLSTGLYYENEEMA